MTMRRVSVLLVVALLVVGVIAPVAMAGSANANANGCFGQFAAGAAQDNWAQTPGLGWFASYLKGDIAAVGHSVRSGGQFETPLGPIVPCPSS